MSNLEFLLSMIRNSGINTTIEFKSPGEFFITVEGVVYNGSSYATDEAILNALQHAIKELRKQNNG